MRSLLSIAFSIFSIAGIFAQGVTISGRIVDSETLDPLPFAHIFIDQTTIVTVSDVNGEYVLEHVERGDYKIVFSYVGYEMHFETVTINNDDTRISVRLVPTKEMLESVEVRGTKDKEWEKQLKQFNQVFFGTNEFAKDCKIINPWVLDFREDWEKTFWATASEPLKIENKALGYNVQCILQGFSFNKKGYKILGLYKFEEVNTLDKKEAARWTRNRRFAYQNSLRFLCKSILDNHENENGFRLLYDLRPELDTPTSGYFVNELGKTLKEFNSQDHIQPSGRPGYYKITVDKRLQIHHTTQFAQTKTYRDLPHPVSWIEVEQGYILASQDGNIINNHHITTSGQLYNNRIATMLPTNYSPGSMVVINYLTKRAVARRLQERVYLHTDKGIYYPGETVWMKAYTNYANQSVKDSLSKVLYVDMIGHSKNIIESKILKLDSTYAWGEFVFTDDNEPGIYYLRSYTEWMLNYGTDIIHYKPILLLPKNVIVNSNDSDISNDDFLITVSRDRFKWPGNIEVTVNLDSNKHSSVANCSIAITPVHSQLPSAVDIHDALFFPEEMPEGTQSDFTHDLEYNFSVQGQLYRKNKKNISGSVTAIQGNMDSIYHFRTSRSGFFEIQNLNFYDTTSVSFQSRNKRGKPYGDIRIIERETPTVNPPPINFAKIDLDSSRLDHPILITSILVNDSAGATNNTTENISKPISRTLSNADYTLGPGQLELIPNGTNIIDALIGRIPGLTNDPQTGSLSFRGRSTNDNQGSEPLIVVDGLLMNMGVGSTKSPTENNRLSNNDQVNQNNQNQNLESSTLQEATLTRSNQMNSAIVDTKFMQQSSALKARDLVGHITVEYVTRVEINLRGDARYGSASSNGVISIYTQKIPRNQSESTIKSFVVEGFSRPRPFAYANFLSISKGYNPLTLYWNPSVSISSSAETKLSFGTPQAPGQYIIRIEGVNANGNPVSSSFVFNLEKPADQTKARF